MLRQSKDDALANHNLASILLGRGETEEGTHLLTRAVEAKPDNPQWVGSLGLVFMGQRRFAEAEGCFRRQRVQEPDSADAWNNLGNALRALGRAEDALACYRRVAELAADDAGGHVNLGIALNDLGRAEEAEVAFRRALEISPDLAAARNNLGVALKNQGRLEDAEDTYRLAVDANPDFAEGHANLGGALKLLDRMDEAEAAFLRALDINPGLAQALNNLGALKADRGAFDEAETLFRRTLDAHPDFAEAWLGLSGLKRFAPGDEDIARMKAVWDETPLRFDARTNLAFALAKALDDAGDVEAAFGFLEEGNRLKRKTVRFDAEENARRMEAMAKAYPGEARGGGDPDAMPVFVVGMPRSGTTLVEQILASHPAVTGAGELGYLPEIAEGVDALDDDGRRALGAAYLEKLRRHADDGALRVVDKMPANALHLGLIAQILFGARIILCRRDARDVCFSCYSKLFAGDQAFAYDLGELATYHRAHERLMDHWRETLPDGRMIEVAYEDVVDDLEGQARRMLDHVGLDWDPACLTFHETQRVVRTASKVQARQPLFRHGIGRWKRYEIYLGPLLEGLGYSSS